MKKFICNLPLIVVGLLFSSCSSEFGDSISSVEDKIEQRRLFVTQLANDYGLDNFVPSYDLIRKNIKMSDAEVEKEIQLFASLKGVYELTKNETNKLSVGRKFQKKHQRRYVNDEWPENLPSSVSGTLSFSGNGADGISYRGSFKITYDQFGSTVVSDAEGTITKKEEILMPDSIKVLEDVNYDAFVHLDHPVVVGTTISASVSFSGTISAEISTGIVSYPFDGVGTITQEENNSRRVGWLRIS